MQVASLFWDGELVFKTTRKKFKQRADHLWHTLEEVMGAPLYGLVDVLKAAAVSANAQSRSAALEKMLIPAGRFSIQIKA